MACCPICGWAVIQEYTEKYDDRKGEVPKTEKEINSFKKAQEYLMGDAHNNSGYISFKRIEAHRQKKDKDKEE